MAVLSPLSAQTVPPAKVPWWSHAVIYEIYPRSFQDSNGDGTGDLNGITQRLDYLEGLGVDAIWIAPMYPSPQVDFGYDVSDYCNVDPRYGTLADFDRLIAAARNHHIRVLLDFVVNHTSDQHAWFASAARSRRDPKHDWFMWSDGRPGPEGTMLPPNNWTSIFGGSAWQWVPAVKQFYYHAFYRQQPDLNWENPAVERAMLDTMRFWLNRGVAGFRLDAVPILFEDRARRDEPVLPGKNSQGDPNLTHVYTQNLPALHDVLRKMRRVTEAYGPDRVLVGETYLPSIEDLDHYYGGARHDELQLSMDFQVGFIDRLAARRFRRALSEVETQLHGSTPLLVFDNHDHIRSWDRLGDGVHNLAIAKLVATLLLTARDTALLYQGEEIGQATVTPARVEDVQDPIGITGWPKEKGRDGERIPMPWNASDRQAGFSSNPKTWLPIPESYRTVNVATESADPNSLLNWHRQLIALRQQNAAVKEGNFIMLDERNPAVLSYARQTEGKTVVVTLNMSDRPQEISLALPGKRMPLGHSAVTLLSSEPNGPEIKPDGAVVLRPFASWVAAIR